MDEWLQAQLSAGLPAFRGSAISGTIAVNQELLNELLANWLAAQSGSGSPRPEGLDVNRLVPFLKEAAIRVEQGTLLVDFEISV